MDRKRVGRREFMRLSGVFAAAAAVAGCRPAATEPTATPEPAKGETTAPTAAVTSAPTAAPTQAPEAKKIVFWWGWTPEIHVNAITAAVRKFEERFPNVKVETGQHEWGEKLTTAFAAGTPPDLFVLGEVMTYAAKGVVRALDDYMASSKIANKDAFFDVSMAAASWKGKIYGIPSLEHGPGLGLVFNEAVLEKKGLKAPDDLPKTWEQAWEQIQEYSEVDENGNIKLLWMEPECSIYTWWADMFDVEAYDAPNERITFDKPGWKDIFDFAVRFNKRFGPEKVKAFYESFPGWAAVSGCAICAGVLGGDINGFWAPGELRKTAPQARFAIDWVPVPASRKGTKVQDFGGHCALIARDAKEPDTAWQLAEYLVNDEVNKILFDGCGFLNFTKAFLAHPDTAVDLNQWPELRFYIDSCTKADVMYSDPSPIDAFIWDAYGKALDSAIFGEKTSEQALADLQKMCSDELQKAIAPA